jgi:DNA polymerase-1
MAILGVSEDKITKDIRRIAKAVNFGIIYGLSPYGLSRDVGISQSDARIFIEKYFKTYPKVKHYMESIVDFAKKNGYVSTILGRKRFIDNLNSSNSVLRQRAERMAINSPIQGSAADIIKLAMIKSTDYLKEKNIDGRLILQVHDELVFEINDKEIEKVYQSIKNIMENVINLKVPVRASYSISKNLGDLK